MLYADHYTVVDNIQTKHGDGLSGGSLLPDDFDFGSCSSFDTNAFRKAAAGIDREYKSAGFTTCVCV